MLLSKILLILMLLPISPVTPNIEGVNDSLTILLGLLLVSLSLKTFLLYWGYGRLGHLPTCYHLSFCACGKHVEHLCMD